MTSTVPSDSEAESTSEIGESPFDSQVETAEFVFADASPELIAERDGIDVTSYRLPSCPQLFEHPIKFCLWLVRAAFGIASLIFMLAVIAAIPIVNFLALGYLLEVEARVARTGRFRDAFLLLDVAPRIGSIALGIWLWVLPLRFLGTVRGDAFYIEPGGEIDQTINSLAPVAAIVVALHICLALARGGSLGCFFRPLKNLLWIIKRWSNHDYMAHATAGVNDFMQRLRLRHHFTLGVKGFAGSFLWLVIPSALYISGAPGAGGRNVVIVLGGIGLTLVLSWMPFLQARFAVTGRWKSLFELKAIRSLFPFAPVAWLVAIVAVYVLSFPLYLTKAYLLPHDLMWLVTVVFIISIYPAKVVTGWAVHRAISRQEPPWFGTSWICRALWVPLIGVYVFVLFFTPLFAQHGEVAIFEHHALLLPVPF
jgi:hypothetical protein